MDGRLTELRLTAFKSVREARVAIHPLTVVVGRNGSGKSNVFDALAVLAALATGSNLRDALDGGQRGPIVRGGSEGCAPLGSDSFTLGCSADVNGTAVHLDVTVQTAPTLQIRSERLWSTRLAGPRRGQPLEYLRSEQPDPYSADILARWHNDKQGVNPGISFRADQLLTAQVVTRVPATSLAGRLVHDMAAGVLAAISDIFLLDPDPHQMREYVPERDIRLRRNADNLSATVAQLLKQETTREELLELTRTLSEAQVSDLSTVTSELGDVMLIVRERLDGQVRDVPARLMSDGTLRFLAIVSALLDAPAERIVGIEEIENGLHPSQASLLLDFLRRTARERSVRTIATTHSPALLDALHGADHDSVVVCTRDRSGWTTVTPLTDFPDYFDVVGRSTLGYAATEDHLRPGEPGVPQERSLADMLGL